MIKTLNKVCAFALEIWMVISLGIVGFKQSGTTIIKYALAFLFPLVAILLWSYLAAPKSNHRLTLPWRTAFKLVLFCITAFLLFQNGFKIGAIVFASIVLVNVFLENLFER